MKAAVLPLFCTCILGWNQFAQGVQPGIGVNATSTNRYAQNQGSTNRYAEPTAHSAPVQPRPPQMQSQRRHAGLPPIKTKFERTAQTPGPVQRGSEKILRPWEVPDTRARQTSADRYEDTSPSIQQVPAQQPASSSRTFPSTQSTTVEQMAPSLLPEQTGTSMRLHPTQRDSSAGSSSVLTIRSAEQKFSSDPSGVTANAEVNHRATLSYENSLRQHSPVPASKLVAPARTARPLQPEPHELVGQTEEYARRDGFTFRVKGTAAYDQAEQPRSQPAASTRSINTLKSMPSSRSPALRLKQPSDTGTAQPLTTSSYNQRTAPSRWIRPNPLRDAQAIDPDSAFAGQAQPHDEYVQQTAAETETASYAQPGTGQADPIPSLSDEPLDLPFDLDEKEPAKEPAKQPAKAADPETDLNLDDFPFDDSGDLKSSPTKKPALPDSPFPAETPATKPAEKKPVVEDDFPFSLPDETTPEKKSAQPPAETPVEKMPPQETPTETQPQRTVPMEAAPAEISPLDSPAPEVTPAEKAALKPITAISTSIAPPSGDLPANLAEGITEENSIYYGFGQANRGWAVSSYHWEATAMCHQPLYFEEVNLERYGYSRGALQPAVSYGQFLVNVIAMPYKVIAEPSREAVYTLGHYRPGSYAPYRVQYPPRSAAGGMFEAGVLLGLVFVIP